MDAKNNALDKIKKVLFLSDYEASKTLTANQLERKKRLMILVSKKMENPMISDRTLIESLTTGCDGACKAVPESTAYRDLAATTLIVGNIKNSGKGWLRYMITEGGKEAYEVCRAAGDGTGMSSALDKIGKYNRVDKLDEEKDWSQMIPPSFEPSDDVTLLGGEVELSGGTSPAELEERRAKFRSIFKKEIKDADIVKDETTNGL